MMSLQLSAALHGRTCGKGQAAELIHHSSHGIRVMTDMLAVRRRGSMVLAIAQLSAQVRWVRGVTAVAIIRRHGSCGPIMRHRVIQPGAKRIVSQIWTLGLTVIEKKCSSQATLYALSSLSENRIISRQKRTGELLDEE
jgi:DUF917 family protein